MAVCSCCMGLHGVDRFTKPNITASDLLRPSYTVRINAGGTDGPQDLEEAPRRKVQGMEGE